jgi:hypothetical protein
LPWLIACVYAQAWADPMRPLIPPANSASASAPAAGPSGGLPDRSARPREGDAPRDAERLIAIRQDSGPDSTKRWQALLGDRWLKVGDRYDNFTVGAIDANSVQLADGRQRRTLHLLPPLWRPGPNNAAVSRSPDAPGGSTDVAQAGPAVLSPHRATGLSSP